MGRDRGGGREVGSAKISVRERVREYRRKIIPNYSQSREGGKR